MLNTKHKDRLFCFIFGKEGNRKWTLSLYNAVNHSSYTDPEIIQITTMQDVLYMGMKNDVSFIITDTMNVYEQQSTCNPNMPLRELMYVARLYDKYIHEHRLNIYGSELIPLPFPRRVVFYNGKKDMTDETLELKDAFRAGVREQGCQINGEAGYFTEDAADIAVRVRMFNINYGHNKELLNACRPLAEYAWLIRQIRENGEKMDLEDAVDCAVDEMPEDFEIRPFLVGNKAEVKQMCITEYNEAETMQMIEEQGRWEGRQEVARNMIRANEPVDRIMLYTGFEKEDLDELSQKLHTALVWHT